MQNRVVHFEIPSDDPQRAIEFFKTAFGWNFKPYGDDYWFISTGDGSGMGIDGGLMKQTEHRMPVTNAVSVANLDETVQKIEQAGGHIVMPKMAVGDMGWVAYFTDPDGNMHSVWQNNENAQGQG